LTVSFDKANKIVLTGASGTLGRFLAPELAERYENVVLTDIVEFPDALPCNSRFIRADIADAAAIAEICDGASVILHFGGVSTEKAFETVLPANFVGTFHIFEAARKNGARVVFASSNHAIGFYERELELNVNDPVRPDGFYGVSKAFGENMGRLYFDKHGVESVHLRIGSALPEPTDIRHLSTWLSYPDLLGMVLAAIEADRTDFAILWGASANTRSWWGKDDADRIAFKAKDNAEDFADRVTNGSGDAIADRFQGGPFCAIDYSRCND
jgi:uronate dehydrogenase